MINTQRVNLINLILVVGMVSAIIFHYSKSLFVGNHSPQFSTFLQHPISSFCDFYAIFSGYAVGGFKGVLCYFPGAFLVTQFFYILASGNPYVGLQTYLVLYIALLSTYLYFSFKKENWVIRLQVIFIWIFCNYAVILTMDTGNYEGICFLFIAFSIWMRIKKYYVLSAILIGFVSAIKIFPAVFLLVICNKTNRTKCAIAFMCALIFFTILPFVFSHSIIGSMQDWLESSKQGRNLYYNLMMVSFTGEHFGHSITNGIRFFVGPSWDITNYIVYYYVLVSPIVLFLAYKIIITPSLYRKVLIAISIICLFPITSTDYKLQYLLIPLVLLCHSKRKNRVEFWICVVAAFILIPKGYIFLYGDMYSTINIIIDPILLIFVLCLSLVGKDIFINSKNFFYQETKVNLLIRKGNKSSSCGH